MTHPRPGTVCVTEGCGREVHHPRLGWCSRCYGRDWHRRKRSEDPLYKARAAKAQRARWGNYYGSEEYRRKYLDGARERNTGWTSTAFEAAWAQQSGKCALCGRGLIRCGKSGGAASVNADHCHETHVPRALLCRICNYTIGNYEKHLKPRGITIEVFDEYARKYSESVGSRLGRVG